jgi:polysaccharide biosynthesis transport protein
MASILSPFQNGARGDTAASGEAPSGSPSTPLLTHYFRVLYRRRWAVIAAVAVMIMIGIAVTMMTTRQYVAVTTIEISREESRVVDIESVEPRSSAVDQEFYETQYGLLRSRALAERVARALNVARGDDFFEMYDVEPPTGSADQRLARATELLLQNLEVRPARLSRLVQIRYSSPDPVFSQRVSTVWADHFIRSNLERRFEAASYARNFLEGRLNQTRQRLEQSERELVAYAGNQGILNIETSSGGTGATGTQRTTTSRSLESDEIIAINEELARATANRIQVQSELQQAGNVTLQDVTNPTISALRQRRAEVAAERARLLTQFEEGYPAVLSLTAQLTAIDRSLTAETGRIRASAAGRLREAQAREDALRSRVNQLTSGLIDLRRRSIQYNILQRDVDTNRQLYDGLLQRYKEIGIAGGVGTNNVAIVDRAEVPRVPARPRPLVNILLALIAGLGVGVVIAFALEQIDETINDPQNVERLLGLPLLGTLPIVRQGSVTDALQDPKSDIAEAYSAVRTSLSFATPHGIPKVMAVTSTRPAEGKTTTAMAVALSIARLGRRVVLIDADMRNPSLHKVLELRNEVGLSAVLSGAVELDNAVQKSGDLFVLTAGQRPPNPGELLSGPQLPALRDLASTKFDHVIFDCPPVMGLADAPILANAAEGVVFAMESNGTKARFARVALDRLQQARAAIVGVVLTKFDPEQLQAGYSYEYGYGYGRPEAEQQA